MAFRMIPARTAIVVAVAAVCTLVVATRVPIGFERTRLRLVTTPTPASQGSLSIALPDRSGFAGRPVAVVLRLRGGTEPTQVTVRFDGTAIADASVGAGATRRVDATATPASDRGHQITLHGTGRDWQLAYLEVANVHGFSSGLFAVEIVPAATRHFRTMPWWLAPIVFIALLALRSEPGWPGNRAGRVAYRSAGGVVLTLLLAALVGDRVSDFKILVRPQTFALALAVLYAQRTLQLGRALAGVVGLVLQPGLLAAWRWVVHGFYTLAAMRGICAALAGVTATGVTITGLVLGSHVAGGADSYGYVSQAELWASGRLYIDQPLARELPAYVPDAVLTPLGYAGQINSGVRGRIVPIYSPGLPLLMAPLRAMFGRSAVYVVVPLLAGLAVWLTFVLGRQLDGEATGLFAAVWLATSPAFIASALTPLSDVATTAWWLLALVASQRGSPRSAVTAGAATALAILTRPNLVPLAIVVGAAFVVRWLDGRRRARAMELGLFGLAAAAGPVAVAIIFNYWYGSPFTSGYGSASALFGWSYVAANLERYPGWFLATQTPLALAAIVSPLLWQRRGGTSRRRSSAAAMLLFTFVAVVWAIYLAYFFFEHWSYLRFLLPSYPPLLVLASSALIQACRRTAAPRLLATTLLLVLALYGVRYANKDYVFNVATSESRYRAIAEFADRTLPPGSVLLSMQHSGSLRHYSRLVTMRYDFLPEDKLDDMIDRLTAAGHPVYTVLDDWEMKDFRARFAHRSAAGKLDGVPTAALPGGTPVYIYELGARSSETSERGR